MPSWFTRTAFACAVFFLAALVFIALAPYEREMGLVQKIFYFHTPSAWMFLTAGVVCGVASARYLWKPSPKLDRVAWASAELLVLFGAIALVTGPLWARKTWGVWWQWDVRLTSSLLGWMIGVAYLLVRRYAGPGSDKLAAGLALFGIANVPFIYISVNYWRTIHPPTSVVPRLPLSFGVPFYLSVTAFTLLFVMLLRLRVHLEEQRARMDSLYLSLDE
jgi:heme exporter protein C